MAQVIAGHHISREEYLQGELASEIRHDYITIQPLQTYILAETDRLFLTLHRRDGADFRREILSGADAVLELPEVGIAISLAELYRDVG